MRKFLLALKLAAAGLLLVIVTTAATALVALFGDSDCLRGAVTHSILPSPTFRISADRRVLEFDGPITFGVAATLERLLETHATIKVLHLTSSGGRVTEARRMAALVKDRNLDTYVSGGCGSACVDVFLAGRERLIGSAGWLGLHQTRVAGPGATMTEEDLRMVVAAQIAELRSLGVSEAFAKKAAETPHHDVWSPSQRELLAEDVVTRVVDQAVERSGSPRFCGHAPSQADLLASLGGVIYNMGGADAAIRYLDWAIASDPDHGEALTYRAMASTHKREPDRAIDELSRVIKLDPKSFSALLGRGRIYWSQGHDDRAIRDFDEALRIAPAGLVPYERAMIVSFRGDAYFRLGDYARAIADYTRTIELEPKQAGSYNARAWTYFKAGKAAEGLPDAERALQLSPSLAQALVTRAHIFGALGRHEEAIADYTRTIELEPKRAGSYNARAWAYFKAGRAAEGLPDAERALQLKPRLAAAVDTRGHIFEALGRHEEAIADFRRALAINPRIQESKDGLKRLGAAP